MASTKYDWTTDPLRKLLKQDIVDGTITPEMKPATAALVRAEWGAMHKEKKFTARLRGMRSILENEATKQSKKQKWTEKNPVRRQMKWDVADEIISSDMMPEEAFRLRAIYQEEMNLDKFASRLESMREIVKKGKEKAQEDADALEADRLRHPRPTHNHRGEPEWNESDAKECLESDMDAGLHRTLSPEDLWKSRAQYQDFRLETFRGHIHQEEQTRKWRDQWVDGKKQYALVERPY